MSMSAVRASVIVVSRHRPRQLAQCLGALTAQTHPAIEVVLVADPGSVGICPDLPVKRVAFDRPNISQARNLGIAQAAGDVVLFIDDDALAEPDWAAQMTASFADARVIAAAGFTRGPDGLGWQVQAERITPSGRAFPIEVSGPCLLGPENGNPVSTLGTNCAFRRASLLAIGGFDPAFAYHLDESDVNMRLAACFPQGLTAVVPQAEVIHGLAPGTSRAAPGVPHDLSAIGRSTAIFAARHGGDVEWLHQAQKRRLLRLMVAGRLDPLAVNKVLSTLERGLTDAPAQPPDPPVWGDATMPDFLHFPTLARESLFLSGWHWQRRALRARAAQAVAAGQRVVVLLMTPSLLPHRLILTDGGWWEQRGGAWGRSRPGDSPVLRYRLRDRIRREARYFAATR
ncbi:glycosyltransferase family 2 protein [Paracoccus laeviglucosivorans]|uniref:Glycosyltransferase, GT2 family n=1 Tax=Paracoccus laeviglucosivorans TaxID=1197861 RepID=A0A521FGS5_9RHOB|nr:glycosyltransferase family A protein [Paracoccus laeviglucosivorans]SMO95372.1 Glycosyltransferase, GT2 family [Paracoccus laeviglucosivorans]